MNEQQAAAQKDAKKPRRRTQLLRALVLTLVLTALFALVALPAHGASVNIDLKGDGTDGAMGSLQLLFLFALLSLGPSILIMTTSFTRIVIVLSFVRNAIGLQQTPPNQVIVGLALALSLFVMSPVLTEIDKTAVQPMIKGDMTQSEALETMQKPLKVFMLKQTKAQDLNLFLTISGKQNEITEIQPEKLQALGLEVIIPAFVTSELKQAFTIGFLLFLPFLIIDMIVSSTLMSMGMVMLPPSMIALPFKLMLFVVVDGWGLLMKMLVSSFR